MAAPLGGALFACASSTSPVGAPGHRGTAMGSPQTRSPQLGLRFRRAAVGTAGCRYYDESWAGRADAGATEGAIAMTEIVFYHCSANSLERVLHADTKIPRTRLARHGAGGFGRRARHSSAQLWSSGRLQLPPA